jgi:DNA polymerase III epsilon subunit-like protein
VKRITIDTETTGLDADKNSILSICLQPIIIENTTVEQLEPTEIFIKEPIIHITEGAFKVNKLSLEELYSKAVTPQEAIGQIANLVAAFADVDDKKRVKAVQPLGHNVGFDVLFLKRLFSFDPDFKYSSFFSHRTVDTMSLLSYYGDTGVLPYLGSLDEALKHFGIVVSKEDRHTAKGDVLATNALYVELLKLSAPKMPMELKQFVKSIIE